MVTHKFLGLNTFSIQSVINILQILTNEMRSGNSIQRLCLSIILQNTWMRSTTEMKLRHTAKPSSMISLQLRARNRRII